MRTDVLDPVTVECLKGEHPERYRGGVIDRGRLGALVSETEAWKRAGSCLGYGNMARAAYWAGFARVPE